jgi:hypothetical protein
MSVVTEILDRLSGIEVVKERLRQTGDRMEQWTTQMVTLDRQVQAIDRRLTRIETLAEVAQAARKTRTLKSD